MVQRIATVAFEGIEARAVDVQVQVAPGLPAFNIVGLPDKAVSEAKERVRAALIASAVGGADTVYLACGINTLYWRFFTTPNIKTIADLKGKTLGVTTIGSQEDSVVRFILRDRGLIPDRDFAVVAVGGAPTRLAALSKGVIQGSTFIPPQDIAAERLGLNPLIDMSKLGLYKIR